MLCCGPDGIVGDIRCKLDWPFDDLPSCHDYDIVRTHVFARIGYPCSNPHPDGSAIDQVELQPIGGADLGDPLPEQSEREEVHRVGRPSTGAPRSGPIASSLCASFRRLCVLSRIALNDVGQRSHEFLITGLVRSWPAIGGGAS